ncbi:aminotransferase class I/II-fold pyridoxal phosphate-dependent enzyme [Cohnella yongneupensis]|uniref:Aminotransferase class I/II-fold pyridoxal phosphate-dependent enzyme n=1 Tax=Cohnella yongneupensis TaxID=425006 RepID=A0ABW0QZ92_9BACL
MNQVINWMGGWPKEGLITGADWDERLARAATKAAETAAISGISNRFEAQGAQKLRDQLSQSLLKGKTGGNSRLLTVTSGADGALAWILERMAKPGDVVLVERLTSRSALQSFRRSGMQPVAIAGDRNGMDPEALTTALYRYRPKLVYVGWTCTDPEGGTWSAERKQAVRSRCQEAGVLLVTDDRQEMLVYDGEEPDLHRRVEPGVVSIGQLPPGLISGLRIGWIVGATKLLRLDSHGDVAHGKEPQVSVIEQRALSDLIDEQPLAPLIDMFKVQCDVRMRKITELLAHKRLPDLAWVTPKGGLHLWVILPPGLDGETLLKGAWLKGLIFQPGGPFYAKDPQNNTVRLTYAFADEKQLKLGVTRLAESIEEFTGRWSVN